jgi:hypothetical protein
MESNNDASKSPNIQPDLPGFEGVYIRRGINHYADVPAQIIAPSWREEQNHVPKSALPESARVVGAYECECLEKHSNTDLWRQLSFGW